MSEQKWAAIVYGRSYHLDFRFITIPHDFTETDVAWASQHILATTHQARNLSAYPRWSLFKNELYCVVGVTCMVRDLIQLDEDSMEVKTKDNQGRPLYVFVGYVTALNPEQTLVDFPAYQGEDLKSFEPLYQEVTKVWLVKDYEPNSKYPLFSQYEPLNFTNEITVTDGNLNYTSQLNHQARYPDRIFLWSSSSEQNNQLWLASAQCSESTSICLNIKDKSLPNSPFLNQSVSQLKQFTIKKRIITTAATPQKSSTTSNFSNSSLPQKISARAKEDWDLTIQQTAKVTAASQEFLNNFADWSNSQELDSPDNQEPDSQTQKAENFGFKTKKSSPPANSQPPEQDWF